MYYSLNVTEFQALVYKVVELITFLLSMFWGRQFDLSPQMCRILSQGVHQKHLDCKSTASVVASGL